MRILYIGDIVAEPGRNVVKQILPKVKAEQNIDFVIANAENLAHGRGATVETLQEMQQAGVNYFSGGDHLFWQKGFEEVVDNLPVVRPANYPDSSMPGKGYVLIETGIKKILLINVMGRTSFGGTYSYLNDPFRTAEKLLQEHSGDDVYSIIDFHAEATSEKMAFALYLDGKVNAIVGTHTHVPTCDQMVLPNGTLYVTDIGMTGIIDSVLGVKKEIIIKQFLTASNQRFEWESTGNRAFRSVILDTDKQEISRCDLSI